MKNGGSSIHQFLQEALCAPSYKYRSKKRPPKEPWRTFFFNCTPEHFKITYCVDAYRDHPDFFRWAFVRHPLERAVSAWAMARREATGPTASFSDWALNDSLMPTSVISMHWWPQTAFLTDESRCPVFDFVGTLGRFFDARDFEAVLRRVDPSGAGPLWAQYRARGVPHANRNRAGFETQQQELAGMTSEAARALHERYAADFEVFGFDPTIWGRQ